MLLEEHLRRLEDGLADARRELSHAHTLLTDLENPMTRITVSATALAATIEAVRFAVGADPNLPMLSGILFETSEDTLTLVATDRFRLAAASVPAVVDGPPVRVVVPVELVDRLCSPARSRSARTTSSSAMSRASRWTWISRTTGG